MVETDLCNQIKRATKDLLNEGKKVIKAREIAEKTDTEAGDFQSPTACHTNVHRRFTAL